MKITFYGVRGSVPTPISNYEIQQKIISCVQTSKNDLSLTSLDPAAIEEWLKRQPFSQRATYGGNTTCVEVVCGNTPTILDMGTGLRPLGMQQMFELFKSKKLKGYILQSHVHWDHIQGVPFWKPLYAPRKMFPDCKFTFFGGKEWEVDLQTVLRQQMEGQVFPVQFEEIRRVGMQMNFETVFDGWVTDLPTEDQDIAVLARKLNHPQETFGYRLTYKGKKIAFTTDHEPYAFGIPKGLLELLHNVDVWITDCQYTQHEYAGIVGGVQKMGWGHSYPEYIAEVAKRAQPGCIYTTHHDPEASDGHIETIAKAVETLSGIKTIPAYEGLVLEI